MMRVLSESIEVSQIDIDTDQDGIPDEELLIIESKEG
jgi:hypothetical protein